MADPSLTNPSFSSLFDTFSQSVRSVGTAVTLAAVGAYLHQRGFVQGEGKRTLALISQQVTFPLFLFTKIIYCNQNWSSEPCPDVTQSLSSGWMLLIWPVYVVGMGFLVGYIGAYLAGTPKHQVRSVLAACGFANSTGLPVTLLTVVHTNFPATSDLGHIDPTLFLSVYLLLYPVLQWGVGGWLLTPVENLEEQDEEKHSQSGDNQPEHHHHQDDSSIATGASDAFQLQKKTGMLSKNVLNNKQKSTFYKHSRRGMSETDASLYISEADLYSMALRWEQQSQNQHHPLTAKFSPGGTPITPASVYSLPPPKSGTQFDAISPYGEAATSYHNPQSSYYQTTVHAGLPGQQQQQQQQRQQSADEIAKSQQLKVPFLPGEGTVDPMMPPPPSETVALLQHHQQQIQSTRTHHSEVTISHESHLSQLELDNQFQVDSLWDTINMILSRCLQPPVVGAILGICIAVTPMRGIFVDVVDRGSHAPLQWFFDGLYTCGLAAVPINMIILGCNLSASYVAKKQAKETGISPPNMLSAKTMVAIVIGKMIIMPIIGIITTLLLREYVLDIDDEIDGAFYLVMMIVFLTPTANNVMVMVELSGSDTKEGIASVIAMQYIVAPIILSLTMSVAIGFSSSWS